MQQENGFTLLCDSHTHIVYGNREQEFVDRINGMTYEEIQSWWWNPKFSKKTQ
jgi:hypothetical protein